MIYDVAIVGGGPAGSAVATVLARRGRRVIVFERSRFETARIGETFGGELQPLLRTIGAWDAFAALPQVAFRAVRSAWGTYELSERTSITNPFGDGFHVQRAGFDALLARVAAAAGASVHLGSGPTRLERTREGFRLQPACGEAALARFLVDASGRGAPASAALSGTGRWLPCDRMVALIGRVSPPPASEPALLIEASEDGWWYSAPQPDGTAVVVLMTDADLAPAGPRNTLAERWRAALARTRHTVARIGDAQLAGAVRLARAESGCLVPDRGPGYCAVGDAEMAFDPLAGNGVVRALRSGLEVAEAVDCALSGGPLPESGTAERFAEALDRRARYYLIEGRWPHAPFWARRRPPDWTTAPLTLPPTSLLRWDGRPPARDALAKAEALLPRRAITATLDLLRTPKPAHAALHALRSLAPLGDRRLLIGLQLLVEHGSLECVRVV